MGCCWGEWPRGNGGTQGSHAICALGLVFRCAVMCHLPVRKREAPNGLELSCPAEAGNSSLLYGAPTGRASGPGSAARRASFSELLGGAVHAGESAYVCAAPTRITRLGRAPSRLRAQRPGPWWARLCCRRLDRGALLVVPGAGSGDSSRDGGRLEAFDDEVDAERELPRRDRECG